MQQVWINGAAQDVVSVYDRGFSYGDGLFETVRVAAGQPQMLEQHLARLNAGLKHLKFPDDTFVLLLTELEQLPFTGDQVLKITVSRGVGERGYALPQQTDSTRVYQLSAMPDHSAQFQQGVAACFCRYQLAVNPFLAGIKHLNRLEQVMARSELAAVPDYAEGIVSDLEGHLVEGTMSNLFWVKAGVVMTPALDRCGVEGVMRNYLIAQLRKMNVPIREGYFPPSDLLEADEIFLTNSLIKVWPVTRLENKALPIGPVTRKLQAVFTEELYR
jgi:4-amino-4-deoxychorismate lyase